MPTRARDDPGAAARPLAAMTAGSVPARLARRAMVLGAAAALAGAVHAQATSDQVRAQVASARLGAGYAQMINLSSAPDFSAATYRIRDLDPSADLDVLRLPYEAKWLALSDTADLYWNVEAGWLRLGQDFAFDPAPGTAGTFGSRWTSWSVGAGVFAKARLGRGFTIEPALDVALARLQNRTSYDGAAAILQPVLDGVLFNWNADAWLVTPGVALDWSDAMGAGRGRVRGHVARSWISSFDETDPVQRFREAINVYSVRAEYVQATAWKAFERRLSWVAYGSYAGFFGANRDALGFSAVAEVGGGLELPVAMDAPRAERVRFQAAYLFGAGVRGWTVGLGVEY